MGLFWIKLQVSQLLELVLQLEFITIQFKYHTPMSTLQPIKMGSLTFIVMSNYKYMMLQNRDLSLEIQEFR